MGRCLQQAWGWLCQLLFCLKPASVPKNSGEGSWLW